MIYICIYIDSCVGKVAGKVVRSCEAAKLLPVMDPGRMSFFSRSTSTRAHSSSLCKQDWCQPKSRTNSQPLAARTQCIKLLEDQSNAIENAETVGLVKEAQRPRLRPKSAGSVDRADGSWAGGTS